jgi:hypothetical protein
MGIQVGEHKYLDRNRAFTGADSGSVLSCNLQSVELCNLYNKGLLLCVSGSLLGLVGEKRGDVLDKVRADELG